MADTILDPQLTAALAGTLDVGGTLTIGNRAITREADNAAGFAVIAAPLGSGTTTPPATAELPAANTILLLRANGSDTYTDVSNDARTITESGTVGDVTNDSGVQFFSGSDSILFTQTSSTVNDGAGLDVDKQTLGSILVAASTEFFVECKLRIAVLPSGSDPYATGIIMSTFLNGAPKTLLFRVLSSGNLQLSITNGASISSDSPLSTGTDYTVAVSRDSSGVLRMFIDGTAQSTTPTDASAIEIDNWTIGYLEGAEIAVPRTQLLQGNIDELAVVVGAVVHNASYTPATTRYTLA